MIRSTWNEVLDGMGIKGEDILKSINPSTRFLTLYPAILLKTRGQLQSHPLLFGGVLISF